MMHGQNHIKKVYTKLHSITYREAIIFIGEVTRSEEDLFLQHTRISYIHRLLSAYSGVIWRLITLNTVICNFVTAYKDCLEVDDTAAKCNRKLRTAFLNRPRLSLGQSFWKDFSCRLAVVLSVSVQNSQSTTLFWHIQFNYEKSEFRIALKISNTCEFDCIPCDPTRIFRKSDDTS